ncbi:MAG: hypothetical protein SO253_00380 [Bacilli bacterium]|nr:hypothetical protein [Bacilli bacterium]
MKVGVYYLSSAIHDQELILKQREQFLSNLNYEFVEVKENEFNKFPVTLIMVETGGSENLFKQLATTFKGPFYLLTKGENNSLAASLEILRYIHILGLTGEILHGSYSYINNRIAELANIDTLGVIGNPSDWLIASYVDYKNALTKFNVNLIDIDVNKVIEYYNEDQNTYTFDVDYDQKEVSKALKIYNALERIVKENNLKGLTLRCFDLLKPLNSTGCLGLSLLNDNHITATCEGDVPSMLAMHLLNRDLNLLGFQSNPSRISLDDKQIILAHCSIPLKMTEKYCFDTHFESGIGVGIHGELPVGKVTVFKISNDLKYYYVGKGSILENLYEKNLCRTQIKVKYDDDLTYFLNRSLANHHIVAIGDYEEKIVKMMQKYNVERVK